MKKILVDKTASKGIVLGKTFIITKEEIKADTSYILQEATQKEINRYDNAVERTKQDLAKLVAESDIFAAHLELVQDIALYDGITQKIRTENKNAELALEEVSATYVSMFESMEDDYMRERATDLIDITRRLMCALKGIQENPFENIKEKVIIVAKDLTPSDTACMNLDYVLGFITEEGGITSHVSIIAKNLGIPALVGVGDIIQQIEMEEELILDASEGIIILNPDEVTQNDYQKKAAEFLERKKALEQLNHLPPQTQDGRKIELCANVGSLEEIEHALKHHIDGVGLFRSEFLYMENTHFPTEEEQFEVYKQAAKLLEGKELTVRTLDIGGDKALSYFNFEEEENPFLGYRAIRISLDLQEVFKAQLKALLRASVYGRIRIMYPMIISVEELEKANEILDICKEELRLAQIPFDENIEVGMMIETPASVLCVEDFAKRVDFFSIGTNDLTQYMLAVDRGNKKIANLYNAFHPAVLRSIKKIAEVAHQNNIKVGMCGEFASDPTALKVLIGLGLDELSMSAGSIAEIKYLLRQLNYEELSKIAKRVVQLSKIEDINTLLAKEVNT